MKGWTKYYGGEITRVNDDGTYDIKFDDGERKRGVKNDDSEYLEESVKRLTQKIEQLKQTYAWRWGHTHDHEKEIVKGMILQSLGLEQIEEK